MLRNTKSKLLFLLAGDQRKASSRVRGYWIAEALENLGFRCNLRNQNSKPGLLYCAFIMPFYDAVIFQKTYSRYHLLLMQYASLLGKPTYLDIDDAPSRTFSEVTLKNFEAMARIATGVFAGSSRLFDYVEGVGGSAHLVPSGIKLKNYDSTPIKNGVTPVCIGWIGNGAHYSHDLLSLLREPLSLLARNHRVKLKIIGALDNSAIYQGFSSIDTLEVSFVDELDWADPLAVASEMREIDIGVYPLLHSEFNEFKCGYKALEYMACSIPLVATPNQANTDIVRDQIDGYFASSSNEWYAKLEVLVTQPELRRKMGAMGRARVEEKYNVDCIAQSLLAIFPTHGPEGGN